MSSSILFSADDADAQSLRSQGYVPLLLTGYWATPDVIEAETSFLRAFQQINAAFAPLNFSEAFLQEKQKQILNTQKPDVENSELQFQAEAVYKVLSRPKAVSIITGPPGTTKSTIAALCCQTMRQAMPDIPIVLMTQEIPALQRLQNKIHLADAVALGVDEALQEETIWPDQACLLIDEAGLLCTDIMARLFEKAVHHKVQKIILIGDDKQLAPNKSGQPFRWLCEQDNVNRVELSQSFRQRTPTLRKAVHFLYHGDVDQALNLIPCHFYQPENLLPALKQSLEQCTPDTTYVIVKGSDDLLKTIQLSVPDFKVFSPAAAQGLAIDRVIFIMAEEANRAELLVGCSRQRHDLVILIDHGMYRDLNDFKQRVGDYPQSLMVLDILTPQQLLDIVDQA